MTSGSVVMHSLIMHDVVIPARAELMRTLGPTVEAFANCELIDRIIVVDDGLSPGVRDDLESMGRSAYGTGKFCVVRGPQLGKGQAVTAGLNHVTAERVVFCDGDLHGMTKDHVWILAAAVIPELMIIGVTEYTEGLYVPWKVRPDAWVAVQGERSLPMSLLSGIELHGYAMEVQVNQAAQRAGLHILRIALSGVHGTPRWSEERASEMRRDGLWLRENGMGNG